MVLSSNSLRKKNVQAKDYDYIYLVCDYAIKRTKLDESPFLNGSYIGLAPSLVIFYYGDNVLFLLLHTSLVKSF